MCPNCNILLVEASSNGLGAPAALFDVTAGSYGRAAPRTCAPDPGYDGPDGFGIPNTTGAS